MAHSVTVVGRRGITRDVTITYFDGSAPNVDEPQYVEHLFDANGSETFDPTEAVEVAVRDGTLLRLKPGDAISIFVAVE
jgi:hypothetical protein